MHTKHSEVPKFIQAHKNLRGPLPSLSCALFMIDNTACLTNETQDSRRFGDPTVFCKNSLLIHRVFIFSTGKIQLYLKYALVQNDS